MIIYALLLIPSAILLANIFKKNIAFTIPMVLLFTIIVMYIFGVLNLLIVGVYAVVALLLASLLYLIFYSVKRKFENFKSITLTPLIVFVLFCIITFWAHKDRWVCQWDEFTHWGLLVKNMYSLDAIIHPLSTDTFHEYPPASALLQYLFLKIRGVYAEEELYRGINLIYFALIMPLFTFTKKPKILKTLAIILIAIILPITFINGFFRTLLIDSILGVIFAYILLIYYTNKFDIATIINISAAAFVLAITKASGVGLAFMALIIIYIDLLFFKRKDFKNFTLNNKKIWMIVLTVLPILCVLIAKFSWKAYYISSGTTATFTAQNFSLKNLLLFFTGRLGDYPNTIIGNFFSTLTHPTTFGFVFNISIVGVLAIIGLLAILAFFTTKDKKEQKRILAASVMVFCTIIVYMLSLLVTYVFMFSSYEAMKLAHINRYLSTIFTAAIIFFTGYIIITENGYKLKKLAYSLILMVSLIIVNVSPLFEITFLAPVSTHDTRDRMQWYLPIKQVEQYGNKGDHIYFIESNMHGHAVRACGYILAPDFIVTHPWSISIEDFEGADVTNRVVSFDEWEQILYETYEFVYLYRPDERFENDYGKLFEGGIDAIADDTLYRVYKENDKVTLIAIPR